MANVPTTSWNETTPAAGTNISLGDDRIRELKTQIREVSAVDHEFESSGQDSDWGYHKVIHLIKQDSGPSAITDYGLVYQKDVNSDTELFYRGDEGTEIQLTNAGVIYALDLTSAQTTTGAKTFEGGLVVKDSDLTLNNAIIAASAYSTGNADVTEGSATVATAGATLTSNARAGQLFRKAATDTYYAISSVDNDNQLTLTENYAGTSENGISFEIIEASAAGLTGPILNASIATEMLADSAVTVTKLVSGIARIKVDTYTGDGNDNKAITDTGFQPIFLVVWRLVNDSAQTVFKTSEDGTKTKFVGGAWIDGVIKSLDSGGFTLGTNAHANANGGSYVYIAFGTS